MQALTFITLNRRQASSTMIKEALSNNSRTRLLAECEDSNKLLTDVMRLKPAAAIIALDPTNAELDFKLIKQLATTCAGTAIITATSEGKSDTANVTVTP